MHARREYLKMPKTSPKWTAQGPTSLLKRFTLSSKGSIKSLG